EPYILFATQSPDRSGCLPPRQGVACFRRIRCADLWQLWAAHPGGIYPHVVQPVELQHGQPLRLVRPNRAFLKETAMSVIRHHSWKLSAGVAAAALLLAAAPAISQTVGKTAAVNPSATGSGGRTLTVGADIVHKERIKTSGSGTLQ